MPSMGAAVKVSARGWRRLREVTIHVTSIPNAGFEAQAGRWHLSFIDNHHHHLLRERRAPDAIYPLVERVLAAILCISVRF